MAALVVLPEPEINLKQPALAFSAERHAPVASPTPPHSHTPPSWRHLLESLPRGAHLLGLPPPYPKSSSPAFQGSRLQTVSRCCPSPSPPSPFDRPCQIADLACMHPHKLWEAWPPTPSSLLVLVSTFWPACSAQPMAAARAAHNLPAHQFLLQKTLSTVDSHSLGRWTDYQP
jgi:hypothetical protein